MKHSNELSTYTPEEFKALAKATLFSYRNDNPERNFKLDTPFPWFISISGGGTQLVVQIKDKDGWVRQHTILL